ncbi:Uncharacterised protein [Porphyromonas cangingivalis]|nr:Uncharacterised protein [Porphyromonas cangingivalis]
MQKAFAPNAPKTVKIGIKTHQNSTQKVRKNLYLCLLLCKIGDTVIHVLGSPISLLSKHVL